MACGWFSKLWTSKVNIFWGWSSSRTEKSFAVSPDTGLPMESVTTTSTITRRTVRFITRSVGDTSWLDWADDCDTASTSRHSATSAIDGKREKERIGSIGND